MRSKVKVTKKGIPLDVLEDMKEEITSVEHSLYKIHCIFNTMKNFDSIALTPAVKSSIEQEFNFINDCVLGMNYIFGFEPDKTLYFNREN